MLFSQRTLQLKLRKRKLIKLEFFFIRPHFIPTTAKKQETENDNDKNILGIWIPIDVSISYFGCVQNPEQKEKSLRLKKSPTVRKIMMSII